MDVIKLVKKQKNISKRGLGVQYDNTISCQTYYADNTMNYRDTVQFEDSTGRRRKAMVNFNDIQSNVDSVVGFFAQNRRQAKYIAKVPNDPKQELYSKNMNGLYFYHRENMYADHLETDQDADMMINGYGAIETDLSYITGNATSLPNGEIIKVRLDPLKFYWDPHARGRNFIDARWMGYWEDYDLSDALNLLQDGNPEDFERVSADDPMGSGYVYNPWGGLYDKIKAVSNVDWTSEEEDLVRVYNHQWYDYETFYKCYNPLYAAVTPEDALFIKARLDVLKEQIKEDYPDESQGNDPFEFDPSAEYLIMDEKTKRTLNKEFDLEGLTAFTRKCFYTAVFSGDHLFKKFKSISQQGFSIKAKTGIYNAIGKFWIGMVNAMIEPQKYKNKALTEMIFAVAALSKGGVMIEEDAVEDIAEFSTNYAKTDGVIVVASGALASGKIQPKAQAALPTGLENIITLTDQALVKAGVDPSFLGDSSTDESGILFKRRIRQVLSKMARYSDSITQYQKEDARLMADLIPVWVENNEGEWVRITGTQGAEEFMQISSDALAAEYDVTIQEAPQTPEDKERTAALVTSIGDKLLPVNPQAAMGMYAESLQLVPLDGDVRQRMTQILVPQDIDPAQVAQMQQMLQELQAENAQLKSEREQAAVDKMRAEARFSDARAEQTFVNNELVRAKIPQTHAQTVKTLEEAARTSAEANIAQNTKPDEATVTI